MRKIYYVYRVNENGEYKREFKTANALVVKNTITFAKLNNAIDSTCKIAVVVYQNGEKIGEWKNF